jgi:hypothetical protein
MVCWMLRIICPIFFNILGPGSRIYCIDKQTQSLVCVGDADDDEEDLEVGMNMLWQCVPQVYGTFSLQ